MWTKVATHSLTFASPLAKVNGTVLHGVSGRSHVYLEPTKCSHARFLRHCDTGPHRTGTRHSFCKRLRLPSDARALALVSIKIGWSDFSFTCSLTCVFALLSLVLSRYHMFMFHIGHCSKVHICMFAACVSTSTATITSICNPPPTWRYERHQKRPHERETHLTFHETGGGAPHRQTEWPLAAKQRQ